MIRSLPYLILALLAAQPLAAQCLTSRSVDTGVVFTRENGRTGSAVRVNDKLIRIDYAVGARNKVDRSDADWGIYTLKSQDWSGDPDLVGGVGVTETTFRRSGRAPEPQPGKAWKTRLRTASVTPTTTAEGKITSRATYQVTYSFQEPRDVTLSGCSYRMMPVEATFVGETSHFTRRWAYFPDLGFGLVTRYTDHRTGVDTRMGLTALRLPK